MGRRKRKWKLKYLALAVLAGIAAAYLFLDRGGFSGMAPQPLLQKQQTGYKAEDRLELERLIHEGTKND